MPHVASNVLFAKHPLAACIKTGLALQGLPAREPIAPQPPLPQSAAQKIAAALARVGGVDLIA
jgi:4-hydroxy-tetrahydrodipicolinate synthase